MSHNVSVEKATKTFGDFRAVDGMSINIKEGEFFTLLGPSGCGKTTLLRMIAGFNSVDEGAIYFGEQLMNDEPTYTRNIGMVFQSYAIFPHLTVRENVAYGLKARKIKGEELETRVQNAMEMMQIEKYADRSPEKLSGGQQQRIALARAIVIHPGVLLMDEPLSNLDAKLRVEMRTLIRKTQQELNITTVYVTHDQEEALSVSDRIAVMNHGKIEQLGTPEEIYIHPVNQFVSGFIGTSSFIHAEAKENKIYIPDGQVIPMLLKNNYEGTVILAARPEFIVLGEKKENMLHGTIILVTFLGGHINYEVKLNNEDIVEVCEYTKENLVRRHVGDIVSISFAIDKVNIFDQSGKEDLRL